MENDTIKKIKRYLVKFWQPLTLLTLVVLGIVLTFMGVFDWQKILSWAQFYTHHWWTSVVLILIQAALYTFALPGSIIFWVVAPLYEPFTATTILVTGSTLGALSAYLFAHREALGWSTRIQDSYVFQLLKERGDLLTLCALRTMPNFPHSVINYGSGILRLPLGQFLASSIIGFSLKSFLYCNAVHGAVTAADPSELVRFKTVGPLILVALLIALAEFLRLRWLRAHHNK